MSFSPFRSAIVLAISFVSTAVFAQKTNFGFYLGPTMSSIQMEQRAASDISIDPYDFKGGFVLGGFGTFTFADNVGIRGELNFERKGGKSGVGFSNSAGDKIEPGYYRDHFDYLQVPILFQLSAGKDFKMYIQAGYAFSYLVQRTDKFPPQIRIDVQKGNGTVNSYLLLMPEDYKPFDHSLVAGVGASPLLANGLRLQLGLRVMNGKLNLSKGQSAFDARNLSVGLLMGVEF